MVRTDSPPTPEEERLQRLVAERERRRRELEEFEKTKRKELEQAEEEIARSEQELRELEEETSSEPVRIRPVEEDSASLEETLEREQDERPRRAPDAAQYAEVFERIREGQAEPYDVANRGVYHQLEQIRNRAAEGAYLGEQERAFVEGLRRAEEVAAGDPSRLPDDPFHYRERNQQVLEQIAGYVASTPGDHQHSRSRERRDDYI